MIFSERYELISILTGCFIVLIEVAWAGFWFMGNTWPQKGYHAPPAGVRGGSPRVVTNFKILKRLKVYENESIFENYQHFYFRENQFFYEKFQKDWTMLQRFLNFSKYYFKNITSEKFPMSSIIYFCNLSITSKMA